MAGLLQPAQHHDAEEITDMKGGCGRIEADIGGDRSGGRLGIEPLGVRNLMDETPRSQGLQKFGLVGAHEPSVPIPKFASTCSTSDANFGIKGTLAKF